MVSGHLAIAPFDVLGGFEVEVVLSTALRNETILTFGHLEGAVGSRVRAKSAVTLGAKTVNESFQFNCFANFNDYYSDEMEFR